MFPRVRNLRLAADAFSPDLFSPCDGPDGAYPLIAGQSYSLRGVTPAYDIAQLGDPRASSCLVILSGVLLGHEPDLAPTLAVLNIVAYLSVLPTSY